MLSIYTHLIKLEEEYEVGEYGAKYWHAPDQMHENDEVVEYVSGYVHLPDQIG